MKDLLSPKDAAQTMGLSAATITRCVKLGAPVHRWGSTGYRYRINVAEFTTWMERQNAKVIQRPFADSADELASRRRTMMQDY